MIDVLVANTRPIVPGAVIHVRPIGVLKMEDDGGGAEKIIAMPSSRLTQRYQHVQTYTICLRLARQIEHFFLHYKDLEPGKWVRLAGWAHADEARGLIEAAMARVAGAETGFTEGKDHPAPGRGCRRCERYRSYDNPVGLISDRVT
jgi:inorganic pyrophosphatase